MKDCLTTSSLAWKLMMSLGQHEPIYTYNHQYTRHFIREACDGRRVGANVQKFISSLSSEIRTIFQNLLKSCSEDICNLMQEYKKFVDVYKEEYGNKFEKMTGVDGDYR